MVHAIEKEVLLKLFGERRTKEHIKIYDKWPDYKKAWDIIEKEESKKVIKDHTKNWDKNLSLNKKIYIFNIYI